MTLGALAASRRRNVAAPQFAAAGAVATGETDNSIAVPIPAGVVTNDIILVTLVYNSSSPFPTVTAAPSGFTVVPNPSDDATGGGNAAAAIVYWKRQTSATGAGETTGTYDFTLSGAVYHIAVAARYTGCVTSGSPIDVDVEDSTSGGSTTFPAVSLTTTVDRCLLVYAAGTWNGRVLTPPTGFVIDKQGVTDNSNAGIYVCSLAQNTAGSTGSLTASHNVATDGKAVWAGALKPAA